MADSFAAGALGALNAALDRADLQLDRLAAERLQALPLLGAWFAGHALSARGVLLAVAAVALLLIVPPAAEHLLRKWRCTATNFRGETIPQSFGTAIALCACLLLLLDAALTPERASDRLLFLYIVILFGGLGLLDDTVGDRRTKGLRGHLRALVRERKVTTGLIKAAGGLAAGLWIGFRIHAHEPLPAFMAGGLIALSANAMNLLDLRPGRACGCFVLAAGLLTGCIWLSGGPSVPGLLFVALPTLASWRRDAAARVMLGDTGSNLLGAAIGLCAALYCGIGAQAALLTGLGALHIAAERLSLTRVIEATPLLRRLDRLTGVR